MTTIAIMQPTYLPWMGYFGMMDLADEFILLDSVQFAKRSWQQRNQIKTANGVLWLTVPVFSKGRRDQMIAEVEIDRNRDFPERHIKSIQLTYGKSTYFGRYAGELFGVLRKGHARLVDLNVDLIEWIRGQLGIETPLRRSSSMQNTGNKADLLANLCSQVGATEYLSAVGSKEYLDQSDAFNVRSVAVSYYEYVHSTYPQLHGGFVPYMSVVDVLFNIGPDALTVIRQGCPSRANAA